MVDKANEIIARFGGQSALARSLGVNQSTVQHWAKTGHIPTWRRDQVLRAAQARGIQLGGLALGANGHSFLTTAAPPAPAPPAAQPAPIQVGRADFTPNIENVETQIGELRDQIGQLRTLLEKLVEEVGALREDRAESSDGDEQRRRT